MVIMTIFEQFCSLFNLKHLIKKETCITKSHKSTFDLILTNKPLSFQSSSIETDLSDHHKLTVIFVKSYLLDLTQDCLLQKF